MTTLQFLLPCQCGEKIPIQVAQAGQTVTCRCGQRLDVPTMRGIRQLEPAPQTGAVRPPRAWNHSQGVQFSFGVAITVISLFVAAAIWGRRSQLDVEKPSIIDTTISQAGVDLLSADQVWDEWNAAQQTGLGVWRAPQYLANRETAAKLLKWTVGFVIVAVVAAAFSLGALMFRPKPRRRPARQAGSAAK